MHVGGKGGRGGTPPEFGGIMPGGIGIICIPLQSIKQQFYTDYFGVLCNCADTCANTPFCLGIFNQFHLDYKNQGVLSSRIGQVRHGKCSFIHTSCIISNYKQGPSSSKIFWQRAQLENHCSTTNFICCITQRHWKAKADVNGNCVSHLPPAMGNGMYQYSPFGKPSQPPSHNPGTLDILVETHAWHKNRNSWKTFQNFPVTSRFQGGMKR